MPTFYFVATDKENRIAKGKLEAADKNDAFARLEAAGFSQIDLETDNLKDHERAPTKSVNPYSIISLVAGLVGLGLLPILKPDGAGDVAGLVFLVLLCVAFVSAFVGFFNRHSYRRLSWLSTVMLILSSLIIGGVVWLMIAGAWTRL